MTISVSDTGVGMTRSQISSLFNDFTKITEHRDLNKEGVGLGLTISKNLVHALGGNIQVESEVGIGTIFTMHIPVQFIHKYSAIQKQESYSIIQANDQIDPNKS